MGIDIPLRNELAALARQSLEPRQFPVRRDVEVNGGIAASGSHTAFFDYMWLDPRVIAISVARLNGATLDDALKASTVRQLLRICIARLGAPLNALEAVTQLADVAGLDVAILRLDTASGEIAAATLGEAEIRVANEIGAPTASKRLQPDTLVWIAAGEVDAPDLAQAPDEGLAAFTDSALRAARSGAGCALMFKTPGKNRSDTTLTLANEQAAIPQLLVEARRFLSRHAVPEETLDGMDIALDEILSNSVNYGFADGGRHEILVSLAVEADRLLIEVRDDGIAFDPLSVPQPDLSVGLDERQIGGLGMHFVRTLLDSVEYTRSSGWNVLKLTKTLAPRTGDQS